MSESEDRWPTQRFFETTFRQPGKTLESGYLGPEMFLMDGEQSKAFGKPTFVDETRSVWMCMTEETPDRCGDVVEVKGGDLARYKRNNVFLKCHNYWDFSLGHVEEIEKVVDKEPRCMIGRVEHAPEGVSKESDTSWGLYRCRAMNAGSIGFSIRVAEEIEMDDDSPQTWYIPRRFKKWELLEFSAATVPMHPSAVAIRGLRDQRDLAEIARSVVGYNGNHELPIGRALSLVMSTVRFMSSQLGLEAALRETQDSAAPNGATPAQEPAAEFQNKNLGGDAPQRRTVEDLSNEVAAIVAGQLRIQ